MLPLLLPLLVLVLKLLVLVLLLLVLVLKLLIMDLYYLNFLKCSEFQVEVKEINQVVILKILIHAGMLLK